MKNYYTITAFTENTPGVLYRIADLFLRRKINIESLTVSEVKNEDQSRFTIVVHAEYELVEKIVKQLYRIIEVVKVIDSVDADLVAREIALLKVSANKLEKRKEIEHLVLISSFVRIIEVKKNYLILEKTGTEKDINDFYDLMKPFGIKEFVQSGRIAVFNT
ncbi:acetolactate synthase small subunit [Candidatus Roizmanbacteria bacterium CG_4_9_14_0_2_um_filter_39_13]|uniref:Acetolactate synthase small subunit n=2 Tax=Candidatus Roizmaniibacteriota TaxID=1752723 RepID=A0A2M8EWQ7_9BACT|nr:MAG: acetolactate synthase small subunit [Candidatus Roizmanbacteria bacterium CG_4_10_14_0_2_um_filter_39_12]PJC30302.1 MAG: acetolactate synthase small subunit [Candidatus Roizmanbacteria bacterium CG_4_9_14_0_2_um_filter_39_13]PJE62180.1 MAG: acetolactate synthase small subunit [Candidatus Roizmanbacteria bacterium CG10_big_fil_rev_8_21_14_0_10_39_12]